MLGGSFFRVNLFLKKILHFVANSSVEENELFMLYKLFLLYFYSQVDYRAKLWACNFCYQRNQVRR